MNNILWLASYPKSGNTWFRVFLENLLRGEGRPVNINSLRIRNFSDRHSYDKILGWETSELTSDLIIKNRLVIQNFISLKKRILKTHDAFIDPRNNHALFSLPATYRIIYILRNPLDIAVSFSQHLGINIDATIQLLNRPTALLDGNAQSLQEHLPQILGDWSWHVQSWLKAPAAKIHIIRYEDMLKSTRKVFMAACKFMGLPCDKAKLERAIEHSKFERLQTQERTSGFREATLMSEQFFRRGRSGGWRAELTQAQVQMITRTHQKTMRQFHYLDANGTAV